MLQKNKFHSKHIKMWNNCKRSTLRAKVSKLFKDYYSPKKKAMHPKRSHQSKAKEIVRFAETNPSGPTMLAKLYEIESTHRNKPGSFCTRLLFAIDRLETKVNPNYQSPRYGM